jgi:hypothetical protein
VAFEPNLSRAAENSSEHPQVFDLFDSFSARVHGIASDPGRVCGMHIPMLFDVFDLKQISVLASVEIAAKSLRSRRTEIDDPLLALASHSDPTSCKIDICDTKRK